MYTSSSTVAGDNTTNTKTIDFLVSEVHITLITRDISTTHVI